MLNLVIVLITVSAAASAPSHPPAVALVQAPAGCIIMNERNFDSRPSPLDSVMFDVAGQRVKVCYGRPSARGRTMVGGESVPYGKLWRTGANEPTMIHTPVKLDIAGITVEPGSYSLYTVPGESEWEVIVNRSITQWGHESRYTDEVRAQEVGRAKVPNGHLDEHVETFTISAEPASGGVNLVLRWEHTEVVIPVHGA